MVFVVVWALLWWEAVSGVEAAFVHQQPPLDARCAAKVNGSRQVHTLCTHLAEVVTRISQNQERPSQHTQE